MPYLWGWAERERPEAERGTGVEVWDLARGQDHPEPQGLLFGRLPGTDLNSSSGTCSFYKGDAFLVVWPWYF